MNKEKTNKKDKNNKNIETEFNNEKIGEKNSMAKYFIVVIIILVLAPLIHLSITKVLYKLVDELPENQQIEQRE